MSPAVLPWRQTIYDQLSGRGIEIGAFENPAKLPASCRVEYCDMVTPEDAQPLFPELTTAGFKKIDHLVNLNTGGLHPFRDGSLDFVIFSHVIEHLVNPIRALKEVLRVIRPGGALVIAAPDKNYTFDRNIPPTSFEHLYQDYLKNATTTTPDEYLDIARYIHTDYMALPLDELRAKLRTFQARGDHLHVWTSDSFRDFLKRSFALIGEKPKLIREFDGKQTSLEYFALWRRGHPAGMRGIVSRLKSGVRG